MSRSENAAKGVAVPPVAGLGLAGVIAHGAHLALDAPPAWITLPQLPEHRIVRLHLRNDGDEAVELRRSTLRVLGEEGEELKAVARPPLLRLEPGRAGAMDLVLHGPGRPARLVHAGLEVELPTSGPRA